MQLIRIIKKFGKILSKHQKVRIFELGILMTIGAFLEMASVSLILPFMNAVLEPEKIMSNKYVMVVCDILNVYEYRSFIVILSLFLAFIYVFKNIFLLFQMNVQNRFVSNNQFDIQCRLLHNYISRPYEFFLSVESGEVLRIIKSDTASTFMLLSYVMTMLSEMIVSCVLIVTIFIISPVVTIAIATVLLVIVAIIMVFIRPILKRSTLKNLSASSLMNKWLLQSIQGIKELKIMKKERFFESEFNKNGRDFVNTQRRTLTLAQIPRFMLEAVSMGTLLVSVAIMISKGAELETIIPILSVVAMAAIRLLPSINRISQSMAYMATNEPYLDNMIVNLEDLNSGLKAQVEDISDTDFKINRLANSMFVDNIKYSYPTGDGLVLSDASLEISAGESIGIIGASGAGKTTAVDIMLGLLHPQSGKVLVDGKDIRFDIQGWLSQIGYIPQSIFMLDGTIRENVAFGIPGDEVDDEQLMVSIREAALEEFVNSLPHGLDTPIGERGVRLSGGQRQRIGIARALYTNPSVLFFDEATSALDNETEAVIMDSINRLHRNKTMIIIAHRLSTIEGCDHVYRVENKKIVKVR